MDTPSLSYHPINTSGLYVGVLLPLSLPGAYTYSVPSELADSIAIGKRVEVQFGKSRIYSGVITEILDDKPESTTHPKPLLSVIDDEPIITAHQFKLWAWIASYYHCHLGEVMNAALPANLKLSSETQLLLSPVFSDEDFKDLSDKEYMIVEALSIQEQLSVDDVRKILEQHSVYSLLRSLMERRIIYIKEDLQVKYKPRTADFISWAEPYASQPTLIHEAFDLVSRSEKQTAALMAFIQLSKQQKEVKKSIVYQKANADHGTIKAMVKKGIFRLETKQVSRIKGKDQEEGHPVLSTLQQTAFNGIKKGFENKNTCLLHGVTGSGKTEIYIQLIQEMIEQGQQALYLLPEIALTTQIIQRLEKVFGQKVVIYHSRLNNNERVEVWNAVLSGKSVVLGPRSALFLPFKNLGLVIVDEEHDASYKQNDPAPRYQGRDTAIYLAHLFKAKTLLGTATPSVESYYNAKKGKYAIVELKERYSGIQLPEIIIADALQEYKQKKLQSIFTSTLLEEIKATIEKKEQIILFQNRRGYSPVYKCNQCDWHSACKNCDVSLTYHQYQKVLKCHYCGFQTPLSNTCPDCGSADLQLKGFGTEKIEDELKIFLPDARISRFDLETTRSKKSLAKTIADFEDGRIDILVGTQMVTKGLDFDNVSLVGVMSADQLLQFPNFRAAERAFQLMVQVSGRAGRKNKQGKVIIQTYNKAHPILKEVLENDYTSFYKREIQERQAFRYPPFNKVIHIHLKHKKPMVLNDAMRIYSINLRKILGERLLGPAVPYVSRIRGWYILDLMVKLNNPKEAVKIKEAIAHVGILLKKEKGFSGVRIVVDVDPY